MKGTQAKIGRPRSLLEERTHVRLSVEQRASWRALGKRLGLDLGGVMRVGAALLEHLAAEGTPEPMSEDELVTWITGGS